MSEKKFETKAIRTQVEKTQHREHAVPAFFTSSFTFENAEQMRVMFADEEKGNIYSRFTNPNSNEFIDKMCALEGTEAGYATASGMAAVFAGFAALLKTGDHIVSSRSVFGSTHSMLTKILPKWGIEHTYCDINDPDSWEASFKESTKMIFAETPSNPGVDLIDLEWLGKLAREKGAILHIDNCFATPYLQQPVKFGADLITHSATKYLDGQGRVLGGIIQGKQDLIDEIFAFCRSTGPALSPFNAWLLSKSLETLAVRMDRHCENALVLAQQLEQSEEVDWVKYPFLQSHPQYEIAKKQMSAGGGIVTFQVKGGLERGRNFLDAIEMSSLTANLGDSRTIVSHPSSTTHAKLSEEERLATGITPGLIRVSVGLEHIDDILNDINSALQKSKS